MSEKPRQKSSPLSSVRLSLALLLAACASDPSAIPGHGPEKGDEYFADADYYSKRLVAIHVARRRTGVVLRCAPQDRCRVPVMDLGEGELSDCVDWSQPCTPSSLIVLRK